MDYATYLNSACTVLRQTVWEALQNDPSAQASIPNLDQIVFASPAEQPVSNSILSLWLYRVVENEAIKNRPPIRPGKPRVEGQPEALDLDLWFLITPLAQDSAENTFLLGKVMQVLRDHPIMHDASTSFRVVPAAIGMAEHLHIWEAIRLPYRLSAVYCMRSS